MYKKIISFVLLAISATGTFAQTEAIGNSLPSALRSKMGFALIDKLNAEGMAHARLCVPANGLRAEEPKFNVIVRMQPNEDADVLTQYGLNVKSNAMGFAVVEATASQLVKAAADARVKHMSLPSYGRLFLDQAHPRTGVDRIKAGDGLLQPYTGKGVLAIMEDAGIQPSHPMLLREDGTPKIEYLLSYDGSEYTTKEQLFAFRDTCDDHGTHTSTILAGSKVTSGDLNIEGVAPGVSMAFFRCGVNQGGVLLHAEEQLMSLAAYAEKKTSLPKVVSISLGGGATAATDDDDDMLALLDTLGETVPVCVSAGNYGEYAHFVYHTCKEGSNKLLVKADALSPDMYEDMGDIPGIYYIATQNDKPLKVTVMIAKDNDVVYQMPVFDKNTNGQFTYLSGKPEDADNDTYLHNDIFTQEFGGRLGIASKVSSLGRYSVMITLDDVGITTTDYHLYLLIEGEDGQIIKASGYGFAVLDAASKDIVDDAVVDCLSPDGGGCSWSFAKNVISVGSYVSRATEDEITYGFEELDGRASSSSYAHLFDGHTIPYIMAPGQYIIAGFNKYYPHAIPSYYIDGTDDGLITMDGTSMAAPYVAGVIALWLEADPTLSVSDVKDIIAKTAIKDDFVKKGNAVAWGNGKIDAYNGLKEVLDRASTALHPINADKDFLLRQHDNLIEAFVAGETSLSVNLYNASGRLMAHSVSHGSQATLDTSSIPSGVYILRVQGANTSHSTKIVVR